MLKIRPYTPTDWYWDNGVDVFSSKRLLRVPYSDADYQAFLASDGVATRDPGTTELRNVLRPYLGSRTLQQIFSDVNALSASQKTNINNDLFSGTPLKVLTDSGPNAAAIGVLYVMTRLASLSAADLNLVKLYAATMYVQDNPSYLVHPAFDATINVSGMTF